ncbi:hypothetical protein KFE98_21510 [bacterium SCSIO 12741]|nr:hypothetical protein KFE98_21510 [bacterium SCSIO 12741]
MWKGSPIILLLSFLCLFSQGQRIPNEAENIEFLVTFGSQSDKAWGDDDFSQVVFFTIPVAFNEPFFIRIFDPEVGGNHDEVNGVFDTYMRYNVYGGKGAHSNLAAQNVDPVPGYDSGILLSSKTFGVQDNYDSSWYSLGPFNPKDGEFLPELGGYVFKVTVTGRQGDDGNLYYFFLSRNSQINRGIDGANAFTYEYSFRMPEDSSIISHIYPFIDKNTVSLTQHNFDFDKAGNILVYSVSKNRHPARTSGDNHWSTSTHRVTEAERNTSYDLQISTNSSFQNDLVIHVKNQYNRAVGFYSIPIGGPPKYKYKVEINLTPGKPTQ